VEEEAIFFATIVVKQIICLDWAISVKFHLPGFGNFFQEESCLNIT